MANGNCYRIDLMDELIESIAFSGLSITQYHRRLVWQNAMGFISPFDYLVAESLIAKLLERIPL